jgi:hypothetical protein
MPGGLSLDQVRLIDLIAARRDPDLDVVDGHFQQRHNMKAVARASIREGLDDVIDGRRTRRFSYSQLSSAEKSFCGIRIESALVRNLELPLGRRLDLSIEGIDVDVKVSSKEGWMIGPGQLDSILLLVCFSEPRAQYSVGVVRSHEDFMNPSRTRDAKRSFSKAAKRYIRWFVRNERLPVSVLASLPPGVFEDIIATRARAERLKKFLAQIPSCVPFPRQVIETVVGGDDPLRGTRHDSALAAGDHPLGEFRILSYQRNTILKALGHPPLAKREHMKIPASDLLRVT